jgi:hypothetical protein
MSAKWDGKRGKKLKLKGSKFKLIFLFKKKSAKYGLCGIICLFGKYTDQNCLMKTLKVNIVALLDSELYRVKQ